jgi:hypothetical protein
MLPSDRMNQLVIQLGIGFSGTHLSRPFDSNLTKEFYRSLRCQVSYPIKPLVL